jgi:hypothetical protein
VKEVVFLPKSRTKVFDWAASKSLHRLMISVKKRKEGDV